MAMRAAAGAGAALALAAALSGCVPAPALVQARPAAYAAQWWQGEGQADAAAVALDLARQDGTAAQAQLLAGDAAQALADTPPLALRPAWTRAMTAAAAAAALLEAGGPARAALAQQILRRQAWPALAALQARERALGLY